ncbi:MAG: ABC transporter ATP-binding protein, partial [Acidimicrobiales bacterium]
MSFDERSSQPVIELRGAGKQYTKYEDAPMLLNRILSYRPGQTRRSKLWAIRGVDLQVEAGETVGVIGRNGSGKSTMLRMLAGVTAPSEGMVAARGRVAPLIAVGVGFHPELTGRENIYVNGTILGLARAEIERKLDDILSFAEIDDFIDTPVKFYSSGMFVRLGFAVAVAARPDILLIDEVLAVGDYAFQAKCYERMDEMRAEGATVLVVSHNLNVVRNLCA